MMTWIGVGVEKKESTQLKFKCNISLIIEWLIIHIFNNINSLFKYNNKWVWVFCMYLIKSKWYKYSTTGIIARIEVGVEEGMPTQVGQPLCMSQVEPLTQFMLQECRCNNRGCVGSHNTYCGRPATTSEDLFYRTRVIEVYLQGQPTHQ